MRVVDKKLYNGNQLELDIFKHKFYSEIVKIINQTPDSFNTPEEITNIQKRLFKKHNWKSRGSRTKVPMYNLINSQVDYVKAFPNNNDFIIPITMSLTNNFVVMVEIQFGEWQKMYHDIIELNIAIKNKLAHIGILIVPFKQDRLLAQDKINKEYLKKRKDRPSFELCVSICDSPEINIDFPFLVMGID